MELSSHLEGRISRGEVLPSHAIVFERGQKIGDRLELIELIGEGAMGSVWAARHLRLDADVAVKFIATDHRAKHRERVVTRFEREARLAASIQSPHTVQIHDHGLTDDDVPFIVMERLQGRSLGQRLRSGGPLPLHDVVALVEQVGRALASAHERGVVHRDIKPDNIFLVDTPDGSIFAKVLDFGVAKLTEDPEQAMTTTGATLGTPLYMSPEVIRSARDATSAADLWALAVMAYESLTGVPPFAGETVGALFFSICGDAVDPPSTRRNGLPDTVDAWFSRSLCQDQDKRFATAVELARTFADCARGEPLVASDARPTEHVAQAITADGAVPSDQLSTMDFVAQASLEVTTDRVPVHTPEHDLEREPEPETEIDPEHATETETETETEHEHETETETETEHEHETETETDPEPETQTVPSRRWLPAVAAVVLGAAAVAAATLPSDAPSRLDVSLPAALANAAPDPVVSVRCEPACDAVDVDGQRVEADAWPPHARSMGVPPEKQTFVTRLGPGRHVVKLLRFGYETRAEGIDVRPDAPFDQTYTLTRRRGELAPTAIDEAADARLPDLRACYAAASEGKRKAPHLVKVAFVVDPKGKVVEPKVKTELPSRYASCITDVLAGLQFAPPKYEGFVDVHRDLELRPKVARVRPKPSIPKKAYPPDFGDRQGYVSKKQSVPAPPSVQTRR